MNPFCTLRVASYFRSISFRRDVQAVDCSTSACQRARRCLPRWIPHRFGASGIGATCAPTGTASFHPLGWGVPAPPKTALTRRACAAQGPRIRVSPLKTTGTLSQVPGPKLGMETSLSPPPHRAGFGGRASTLHRTLAAATQNVWEVDADDADFIDPRIARRQALPMLLKERRRCLQNLPSFRRYVASADALSRD